MSAEVSRAPLGSCPPRAAGTLRVEAVFHHVMAEQADAIAAELIGRAHELANRPEHGCDVDVNVQLSPPADEHDGARGDGER